MLTVESFRQRRQHLYRTLPPQSLAVLPANVAMPRNGDTTFPFRQDSDFWYLTGFPEEGAVAVFDPTSETPYTLFCRPSDPKRRVWDGDWVGMDAAVQDYGADAAYDVSTLDAWMQEHLIGKSTVLYPFNHPQVGQERVIRWLNATWVAQAARHTTHHVSNLAPHLHQLRLIKSSDEIELMRRSVQIAGEAHIKLMQQVRPGLYEYHLEAILLEHFLTQGGLKPAYSPIVGGGANGCVLHYHRNSDPLRDGDLVLVDAGCEYQYYASDITRTIPINGRFTAEQAAVYDVVLAAQQQAIEQARPGQTVASVQTSVLPVLIDGLCDLGLLRGDRDELLQTQAYQPFYPHRCSHWLGLDVHDVGAYEVAGQSQVLQPGMMLTVEPGLYIPPWLSDIDAKWRGIAVRIEDDILITERGAEVLSVAVPKTCAAIEQIMS